MNTSCTILNSVFIDHEERPISEILGEFWKVCGEAYIENAIGDMWWVVAIACECKNPCRASGVSRGPIDLYNAFENALDAFRDHKHKS